MNIRRIGICFTALAISGIVGFGSLFYSAAQTAERPAANQTDNSAPVQEKKDSVQKESAEDFYSAGQNIEISPDNANGDVAVAGANVTISNKIQGYLMAAGANVNVNAPIGNDLWAAGANVIVNAPVADNAMLAGSSVVLEQNATIGRDARIAASSAVVKSKIARNLSVSATNAEISSEVGGNVTVFAENVSINQGALIHGDLIVHSPDPPAISSFAKIEGRVEHRITQSSQRTDKNVGGWFSNWFLTFLWITVLGLVAVWFSSVWTNRVAETVRTQTWRSFLVGLIVALVIPVLFILLLITVVGLPLAFLLFAMSLVGFMFSGVFIAYFVGDWFLSRIKRWESSHVLKIVFGALLITFVMALPWIGWLAKLAVFFFGFGAFLLERKDLIVKLREHGLA